MYIFFNKIKIHNFFSIEDAEIKLTEKGFVCVTGVNKNREDNALSNGSGKSTIFEALSWAVTGETIRGTKEIKRRGDNDGCLVEIDFNIDNDNYVITRTKDHCDYKTNLFIYKNGENKSGKGIADTRKLLSEYLPDLTPSLLNSVVILGQGLPARFTNNTPSGRKEVLEKLSKSDFMIEDLKERIDARAKELQDALTDLSNEKIKIQTAINLYKGQIEDIENKLNSMNSIDDIKNQKEEKELEKTNLISEVETLIEERDAAEKAKKEQQDKYDVLNNSLLQKVQEQQKKLNQITTDWNNKIKENETGLQDLITKAYSLNEEIKRLDSVTDICPTCGQKLPDVHKIDTTDKKKELAILNQQINTIKNKSAELYEQYTQEYNAEKETAEKTLSIDKETLRNYSGEINRLDGIYKQKQLAINGKNILKESISESISTLQTQILNYENSRVEMSGEKGRLVGKCGELKDYLDKTIDEEEDINRHKDIISRFQTVVKRDFRGYLLSGVIDYIDKRAKDYCNYLTGNQSISFKQEGNNLDITYNDKSYESLSGGERQRVDLIIQFSLRDMLCKYLEFSCNVLVMDEIFDNLDGKGCEDVLSLITKELKDIDSVFIISHRPDLEIPYDSLLTVEKGEDGVSRVIES